MSNIPPIDRGCLRKINKKFLKILIKIKFLIISENSLWKILILEINEREKSLFLMF